MANESPFSEDENILVAALMQELPKVEEFAKLLTHTITLFIQNAEAVASRIRSEAQSKVEAEMGGYRELQLAKAQAEVEREMTSERQALALLQSERESLEATITTLRQDTARLQGEVNTLRDVKRQILGEMTAEA